MTIPSLSRRLPALGAVITVAISASACSGASEQKAGTKSEVVTTSVAGTGSNTAADAGRSPETTSTGQAAAANTRVIGSSTGQHKATPNDQTLVPLRLDVHEVKRLAGDTVHVRFTLTHTGDTAEFSPYREMTDPTAKIGKYDVGGLALIDRAGDKKYLTLYGTDGVCLCTGGLDSLSIKPGKSASMYADVTAPPASVSAVDLSLPGFAPVLGLKIQ